MLYDITYSRWSLEMEWICNFISNFTGHVKQYYLKAVVCSKAENKMAFGIKQPLEYHLG